MFGAMRSSRHRATPCPCNGTCRCHKKNPRADLYACLIGLGVIAFIPLMFYLFLPKPQKHYIHVGDKICEVQYVETGHTSTGASWGYEKAVCP